MHPSQASIPKLMNIMGQATHDLVGQDKEQQSSILRGAANAVRDLATTLRERPETITAESMPGSKLYVKALELVSKVTVTHNITRESGASENEIESAVADALEKCAETLESDALALVADVQ